MSKIITLDKIVDIKRKSRKLVLVGGCFDIFHIGHLFFLEQAKKSGDLLLIALESDASVSRLKYKNRPIHSQKERAKILASLSFVDFVLCLPDFKNDKDYFDLVKKIKPDVIAVTQNDPILAKKLEQAKSVKAKLVVTKKIKTPSTTQLTKLLKVE